MYFLPSTSDWGSISTKSRCRVCQLCIRVKFMTSLIVVHCTTRAKVYQQLTLYYCCPPWAFNLALYLLISPVPIFLFLHITHTESRIFISWGNYPVFSIRICIYFFHHVFDELSCQAVTLHDVGTLCLLPQVYPYPAPLSQLVYLLHLLQF